MIKANELRLGSFIEDEKGNICKVNSINNDCIIAKYNSMASALGEFEAFNPIKLSEEWFDDFGFKWNQEWGSYIKDGYKVEKIGELLVDRKYGFIIDSVHSLQNAYFVINKKELEL